MTQQQHTNKMTKSKAQKAKAAQKGAKNIGSGRVTAPVATARRGPVTGPAKIDGNPYTRGGHMRVRHREYIGELRGSADVFTNLRYPVNPGMQQTFPWLSAVALDFEKYRFNSLRFVYEPEAPTSTPGYVMMALDYDPADAVPLTKQRLGSSLGAVRSPPWAKVTESADSSELRRRGDLYLRAGTLGADLDIKTYDLANLNLATGNGSSTLFGELWVEYDVELSVPQLDLGARDHAGSAVVTASGVDTSYPYGYNTWAAVTGGLPVAATNADLIFDRVGNYLVVLETVGTSVVSNGMPSFTGSTAIVTSYMAQRSNTIAQTGVCIVTVIVRERGQFFRVGWQGAIGTLSSTKTTIATFGLYP